jgi:uncharacterized iron-regulated membrane protein
VAAHEGQLFGWFNQALGVITAVGVFLLGVSSVVLWWGRRNPGTLGAPNAINRPPLPFFLGMVIVILGTLLPLLGVSLIAILVIEFILLSRIPSTRTFLGLNR